MVVRYGAGGIVVGSYIAREVVPERGSLFEVYDSCSLTLTTNPRSALTSSVSSSVFAIKSGIAAEGKRDVNCMYLDSNQIGFEIGRVVVIGLYHKQQTSIQMMITLF